MRVDLTSLDVALEASRPLSIADGAGARIHILEGLVWLTEEGIPEDVFLVAGAQYTLQRNGRAVLDTDGKSRLVVTAAVSVRTRKPALAGAWNRAKKVLARILPRARPAVRISNSVSG